MAISAPTPCKGHLSHFAVMDAGGIFWLCAICPVARRVLAILQSSCADGWIPALPCHVALAHRSRSVSLILQEPNTCCPWAWKTKGQQDARQQQNALIQKAMKRVLFSLFSVLVLMALHSREVHPVTSWLLPQMVPPKPAHRRRGRLPKRLQDALSQRPGVLPHASPPVQIPHNQEREAVFLVAFPLLVFS